MFIQTSDIHMGQLHCDCRAGVARTPPSIPILCSTRQRASSKKLADKDFFAESFLSGTRQRLYRE